MSIREYINIYLINTSYQHNDLSLIVTDGVLWLRSEVQTGYTCSPTITLDVYENVTQIINAVNL